MTFTVSGAPERHNEVHLESRGDGRFAILHDGGAWTRERAGFLYEPTPSGRSDEYLASARWTFEEALVEAQGHAVPYATRWWADWIAKEVEHRRAEEEYEAEDRALKEVAGRG